MGTGLGEERRLLQAFRMLRPPQNPGLKSPRLFMANPYYINHHFGFKPGVFTGHGWAHSRQPSQPDSGSKQSEKSIPHNIYIYIAASLG